MKTMSDQEAIAKLEAELAAARAELDHKQALLDIFLANNPDAVAIVEADGSLITNPVCERLFGRNEGDRVTSDGVHTARPLEIFLEDGETPCPLEQNPLSRAIRGEAIRDAVLLCRNHINPEGVWIQSSCSPLGGGRAISVFRDISERKRLEDDLARRNAELAEQVEQNTSLVERLRLALDELATPVLELWDDVLALPVVGVVDTQRSVQMTERLLAAVLDRRARFVIIDVTGVDVVDTSTADRFMKLARAVELLGAQCIVSGIQPRVAQTLVDLGVEFSGLNTQRNLKRALDHCVARRRTEGTREDA
jgi:rsbT co-antagonist protein RsbR